MTFWPLFPFKFNRRKIIYQKLVIRKGAIDLLESLFRWTVQSLVLSRLNLWKFLYLKKNSEDHLLQLSRSGFWTRWKRRNLIVSVTVTLARRDRVRTNGRRERTEGTTSSVTWACEVSRSSYSPFSCFFRTGPNWIGQAKRRELSAERCVTQTSVMSWIGFALLLVKLMQFSTADRVGFEATKCKLAGMEYIKRLNLATCRPTVLRGCTPRRDEASRRSWDDRHPEWTV